MEEQAILCLGALTLISSGAELVRLHKGNPLLRGLNLMGHAILVGGVAATLLLLASWSPLLQPFGTLMILVAFSLCHWALSELAHLRHDLEIVTKILIATQSLATLLQSVGWLSSRLSIVVFSCTLALELGAMHRTVTRGFVLTHRSSARFVAYLFRFLIVLDLGRALAAALGVFQHQKLSYWSDTATYGLFIACGIGLAFGFFSMTTFNLTRELERLASTDPLTQVLNRRAFLEKCAVEEQRSERENTVFSMLLLDLDYFKRFNDTFGHQAGDEALQQSVERVQNAIRGIDTICRWGGEEFAVLLPKADSAAARIVAERIHVSFSSLRRDDLPETEWRSQSLTVSVGAATWRAGREHAGQLISRADRALYAAKHNGRNRTVIHEMLGPEDDVSPHSQPGAAVAFSSQEMAARCHSAAS